LLKAGVLLVFAVAFVPRAVAQPIPGAVTPKEGEIHIEVESFGVGNLVRPGSWAGIRFVLTDSAVRPRDVAIRLSIRDGDGDTLVPQRVVTLSPGQPRGVWLYARLPWSFTAGTILELSVNEADFVEGGPTTIGRQLGGKRISAIGVAEEDDRLIGIIGGQAMGLDGYARITSPVTGLPAAHEAAKLVPQLLVPALPDHWVGFDAFDTIVWAHAPPAALDSLQAHALTEWINRGGHLVIVLPSSGSAWFANDNPLGEMLPRVTVDQRAGVDLNRYVNLLTDVSTLGTVRLPISRSIHRFVIPTDAQKGEAIPIINGPDGCVVVRRLIGTGMLTLIGIDIRDRAVSNLLRADHFWHRILGRRGQTMPRGTPGTAVGSMWRGVGDERWVDGHIATLISKGRTASVGVLLGLIVFIVYWVLAGPVGFALLKARGWQRHSWMMFVTSAVVFTLITWTSVNALRPRREQMWHYTLLQHVYGQPIQRARVFASVLLPKYGQQQLTVGEQGVDASWNQVLGPWSDPMGDPGLPFPDSRSYSIDVRDMTSTSVPARSTIKQF